MMVRVALHCAITVLRLQHKLSPTSSAAAKAGFPATQRPEDLRDLFTQAQAHLPCTLFTLASSADTDHLAMALLDPKLEQSDPSTFFASSLTEADIWRSGTVYTPLPLATHIINQLLALNPLERIRTDTKIIDPACGCGVFLNAIIDTLATSGYSAKMLIRILAENMFGIDTNGDALLVAEFSLLLALRRHFPSLLSRDLPSLIGTSLICDNYLTPSPSLATRGVTDSGSVDYFIGNPPFGLSRDGRIDAIEARTQKERHGGTLGGNISSYLLFLSAGYLSLKSSGSLALITPNAWLGIKSAQALRHNLLSAGAILRIEENPADIFSDRGVETVTTYLTKKGLNERITLARVSHPDVIVDDYANVATKTCSHRPAHTIPLRWSDGLDEIFSTITSRSEPMRNQSALFRPLIALQEYAVGQGEPPQSKNHSKERRYHSDAPHDSSCVPFLRGKDVDRYDITWSGSYLNYGPWLAQPGKRYHYEQPRVIIREITGPRPHLIRACATDSPLFYNRSLLHILVTAPSTSREHTTANELAFALSGLLNSTVINAFFFFHGRKVQRALFPKVLGDDLKDLPVPNDFVAHSAELAQAVINETGVKREQSVNAIVAEMFQLSAPHYDRLTSLLSATYP